MLKGILKAGLTATQRGRGFSLAESVDHELILLHRKKEVAYFNRTTATVVKIRRKADRIAKSRTN